MENLIKKTDECLFICYEDVIKTIKPYILKKLQEDTFRTGFESILNYSKFDQLSDNELFLRIASYVNKNIFKQLAICDFDYDLVYYDFINKFDDIYANSNLLSMGRSLNFLLSQKNLVKKVYIYSKSYDERILHDLNDTYISDSRISYVTGDFNTVLQSITDTITVFVINDIDLVNNIIELNKIKNTNVLFPMVGYNYVLDDDNESVIAKIKDIDDMQNQYNFRIGEFDLDPQIKLN